MKNLDCWKIRVIMKYMPIKSDYYEYLLALNNDFADISSSLMENPEVVTLFLNYVNEKVCEKISVNGSAIMVVDSENNLSVRSWEGMIPPPFKLPEYILHEESEVESHFRETHFSLDEDTIFSAAVKDAKPFLVAKSSDDKRIFQNDDEDFLKCGSYIFIPLLQKDFVFGLVVLSRNADLQPFSEDDFTLVCDIIRVALPSMIALSHFLNYQEHSGIKKANELAVDTQKALFLKKIPEVKDVSLGVFHSNGDVTWGDYYDVLVAPKNKVHFLMMDVVGRGMYSLYILVILRALLRLSVNFLSDAASLLTWLNRGLFSENITDNHYASLSIISYDVATRSAEIATAGINSVFYFDAASGMITRLSKTSDPLGMMGNIKYSNLTRTCKTGDIMIVCTDGLIESVNANGEQYGVNKLARVVKQYSDLDGATIAKKVKEDVQKFCDSTNSRDDRTLLIIKVKG